MEDGWSPGHRVEDGYEPEESGGGGTLGSSPSLSPGAGRGWGVGQGRIGTHYIPSDVGGGEWRGSKEWRGGGEEWRGGGEEWRMLELVEWQGGRDRRTSCSSIM